LDPLHPDAVPGAVEGMMQQALQLSIVTPTRNEAKNVVALVRSLEAALPDVRKEIIFVDDSDDETPAMVQRVRLQAQCEVILLHRPPGQRSDGLGGAVVMGLRAARAPYVCVMDADLQHPPALVARLLQEALETKADMVVASRYRDEGKAQGLNLLRVAVSKSFDTLARLAFPSKLEDVSDPMSGFFLVRKAALTLDALRPRGFKILLEILVRSKKLRIAEVPFVFGMRQAGESKAGLREALKYVRLIAHLS
jgi:glycosyltransferase involved in cell wall biosynthesis